MTDLRSGAEINRETWFFALDNDVLEELLTNVVSKKFSAEQVDLITQDM